MTTTATDASITSDVPLFELRHRLALSLEHADVGVQDMADVLGVSRNTVGNYLHGRRDPRRQTLVVWALRCGVSLDWLQTGEIPGGGSRSTIWECDTCPNGHYSLVAA